MLERLRQELQEKKEKGVKQVRVTTVLAALDEAAYEATASTNGGAEALLASLPKREKRKLLRALIHEVKPKIVGTVEAAEALNVERPRIFRLRKDGRFPEPLADPASGPVWLLADVLALKPGIDKRRRSRD